MNSKSGCFGLLLIGIGAYSLIYGICRALYALLTPESAKMLGRFHMHTIAFHDYYTAVPAGSLSTRIIVDTMFTLFVWFLLGLLLLAIDKIAQINGRRVAPWGWFFGVFLLIWGYTIVAGNFIPNRMVAYDLESAEMRITDYEAFARIWPNPIPKEKRTVPFSEILAFRFDAFVQDVRGADHDEAVLLAFTANDTIIVGHTMFRHGEFGWIFDRRSRTEALEDGKRDANDAAVFLERMLGIRDEDL